MTTGGGFDEFTFTARDGLRLYARRYPAVSPAPWRRTALCLAGLTRNSRDFHVLAQALSTHPNESRDVFTFDYRGRGQSQFDPDPRNYTVPVETLDTLDLMTVAGINDAAVIGTSRGGLIAMVMAASRPRAVGAVVLNDIGPVIDPVGLGRISAYVGRIPVPGSWPEAAKLVRDMNVRAFPAVADEDWEDIAHQWFNDHKGRPAPGYDAKLATALSVLDGPLPALWPQFEAMRRVPVMALRGDHSDILSKETLDEMQRRHPGFTAYTVKGQGHAPLLRDPLSIDAVRRFLAAAEHREALAAHRAAAWPATA